MAVDKQLPSPAEAVKDVRRDLGSNAARRRGRGVFVASRRAIMLVSHGL